LHQVKAYKSTLFSGYCAAINTQKGIATDRQILTAYFHIAREITDLPSTFGQDYHPVQFYSYPIIPSSIQGGTKLNCPLDEVDQHIEAQIKALARAELSPWKINICTLIRERLEAKINEKVISVHHKIHNSRVHQAQIASNEFIDFPILYDILEAESYEDFENEEFFLSRLQIDIGIYYQEFCDINDTQPQTIQNKLDGYLATILGLDIECMKDFLRATMPHRKGKFSTLSEFKDETLDRDSMRQGLFTIFRKLAQAERAPGGIVQFAWFSDDRFYYPTGIHTAAEFEDVVCHDILQQAHAEDVECLFECGALITSAIDRQSITHVKYGVDTVEHEEDNEVGTSITSFQQIALVSLNNIPESLKDAEFNSTAVPVAGI